MTHKNSITGSTSSLRRFPKIALGLSCMTLLLMNSGALAAVALGVTADTTINDEQEYTSIIIRNNATLTIAPSGKVEVLYGVTAGGAFGAAAGPGTLVVDGGQLITTGANSNLKITGGDAKKGTTLVKNGGKINTFTIEIAGSNNTEGLFEITGQGSTVTTSVFQMGTSVTGYGDSIKGVLTISDGGLLQTETFTMSGQTNATNTANLIASGLFQGPLVSTDFLTIRTNAESHINLGYDFSSVSAADWASLTDGYYLELMTFNTLFADVGRGHTLSLMDGLTGDLGNGWIVSAEQTDHAFGLRFTLIPEPTTLSLLGLSAAGMLLRRK